MSPHMTKRPCRGALLFQQQKEIHSWKHLLDSGIEWPAGPRGPAMEFGPSSQPWEAKMLALPSVTGTKLEDDALTGRRAPDGYHSQGLLPPEALVFSPHAHPTGLLFRPGLCLRPLVRGAGARSGALGPTSGPTRCPLVPAMGILSTTRQTLVFLCWYNPSAFLSLTTDHGGNPSLGQRFLERGRNQSPWVFGKRNLAVQCGAGIWTRELRPETGEGATAPVPAINAGAQRGTV